MPKVDQPAMSSARFTLRPYEPDDEAAAIELWRRTWQQAYPVIDFSARLDWWRRRWRDEILPAAVIMVAQQGSNLVGFVTVLPKSRYLDQIVVAPETWSSGVEEELIAEARRLLTVGLM